MKKIYLLLLLLIVRLATGCPETAPKFNAKDEQYKQLLSAQLKEYIFKAEHSLAVQINHSMFFSMMEPQPS